MEAQILNDGRIRNIREVHVFQLHITADLLQHHGIGSIGRFRLLVNETEHTLRCRKRTLQFCHNIGDLVDGTGEFAGILNKARKVTQSDLALQKQQRAEHANKRKGHIVDAVDRRAGDCAVGLCHGIGIHRRLVLLVKALQHSLFPSVGTDCFLTAEHFLYKTVELSQPCTATAEEGTNPLCQPAGEENGDGNGHKENQHQFRGDGQHHDEGDHHSHGTLQNLQQIRGKGLIHRVHIVSNSRNQITGLESVEKAHRQRRQIFKHIMAHLLADPTGQTDHHHIQKVRQHRRGNVKHRHQAGAAEHGVKIHLTCA